MCKKLEINVSITVYPKASSLRHTSSKNRRCSEGLHIGYIQHPNAKPRHRFKKKLYVGDTLMNVNQHGTTLS